jgi:hypothetical protein
MAAGIALSLLAVVLFCVFFIGLKTDKTMGFSRHQPGCVERQDNPIEFWLTESVSLLFGILLGARSVKLFKTAYRQLI